MDELDKLKDNIYRHIQGAQQAQIRFVECKSVDWEAKTMDAVGAGDEMEYLDISLGYGYMDVKPKVGAICLIGLIEGEEVVSFLINASEVELVEMNADNIIYNGGDNFGMLKIKELTDKLNELKTKVNALVSKYNSHTHIVNTTGSATAQTGTAQAVVSKADSAASFNQSDYENTKIKH